MHPIHALIGLLALAIVAAAGYRFYETRVKPTTQKIADAQAKISAAAESIEKAVTDELSSVTAVVQTAKAKITALAGTGALSADVHAAITKAHGVIDGALQEIEKVA